MADIISRWNANQPGYGTVVKINPCLIDSAVICGYISLFSDEFMRLGILCRVLFIVVEQLKKLLFVDDAVEFSSHTAAAMRQFDDAGVTVDLIKPAAQSAQGEKLAVPHHHVMYGQCKSLP